MEMVVVEPGMQCTVQDTGRTNAMHLGLAEGGALDSQSYAWANKLLDNELDAACLELFPGRFRARFTGHTWVALTGALRSGSIGNRPITTGGCFEIHAGEELVLENPEQGMISYLAVQGGILTTPFRHSRSSVPREGLEGLAPLREGDGVSFESLETRQPPGNRQIPLQMQPAFDACLTLRLIPGYQFEQFSAESRRSLFTNDFQVSTKRDRMASRLEGPRVRPPEEGILSEGIAFGAVQVTGAGELMILMSDRQSVGGYSKPGCVARADCDRLAQAQPFTTIRFRAVPVEEVQAERILFQSMLRRTRWSDDGELVWP